MNKFLLIPIKYLYWLYALSSFFILMPLVFPVACVASLWAKVKGANVIYQASYYWGNCWMFSIGIRHSVNSSSLPDHNKQYIFIGNHISYLDIPMVFASKKNRNSAYWVKWK
ncbi:MAG TPA: hypothetical protein VKR53_21600 [Puia sp.]|nr:hypothetical protein [Puia sp.]